MLSLPRSSLSSVICPTAPFLAPRLLRVPARVSILQFPTTVQQRAFTKKKQKESKKWKEPKKLKPHGNAYFQSEKQKAKREEAERQVLFVTNLPHMMRLLTLYRWN